MPKQTCALIPISDVLERVSSKLSELLGELKNHGGERETIVNLPSCYVIAMAQGAPSLSYISELTGPLSPTKCLHPAEPDMRALKGGSGFDPSETWAAQDFRSAKALFVPSLKRDILPSIAWA